MRLTDSARVGFAIVGFATMSAMASSNDVWLATKARMTLLTTEGVSVMDADVDVADGVVTLHGKVKTGGEKSRAGLAVGTIEGVRSVRNLMLVAPQAFNGAGEKSDDTIRSAVTSALSADPRLAGVKVGSVNNRVVTLEGATVSVEEERRAIELVWSVAGVARVASRIETRK